MEDDWEAGYVLDIYDQYEEERTILPQFLQFSLIDTILAQFLEQFDINRLIGMVKEFSYGEGKFSSDSTRYFARFYLQI
jgi:hypothetical protein